MRQITLTLLILSALHSYGQGVQGTVRGRLSNGQEETIIGAVVFWEGTRSGTITNETGHYSIGHPPGATRLIFQSINFISDTIAYTGVSNIDVTLNELVMNVNTVNVVGERGATYINSRDPQQFQVLSEKELCKAACCNLSESFETNASVDASYADAITGTRQIRMLGLEGRYTQMLFDNIPSVRGLSSTYGLSYVPGPWVKNIYITKGVGSVTSGYESMAGQINVAMKNPDNADRLYLNAYAGSGGRTELNFIVGPKAEEEEEHHHEEGDEHEHEHEHKHVKGSLMGHGAFSKLRTDMNKDGFLDNPLFSNVFLRNEWHIDGDGGLGAQIALNYQELNSIGGQLDYDPGDEVRSALWGVNTHTRRYEATAKVGYVFADKPWKSFGSQYNVLYHNQDGHYGFREYNGEQRSGRANLLFASRIVNDHHKFTTGLSFVYDDYREGITSTSTSIVFNNYNLNRQERVAGAFLEYTMNPSDKFTLVAGLREDLHNAYGALFTPRLHARYSITEKLTVKCVGGMGYRTAQVLMDNVGMLASNRDILIQGDSPTGLNGLDIEKSSNAGAIFTWKGDIGYRPATLSVDGFITRFENQVVVDFETPRYVSIYNLKGKSYSNSAQAEFQWSPARRLDWRLAYRWLEARTEYSSGLKDRPLVNKHRAFTNLAYETRKKSNGSQWRFDATVQWISKKRIPFMVNNAENSASHTHSTYSQDYWQVMAQVTYVFRPNFEVYLGGENLTNFMVHDAIISAENPSSNTFDASQLWGPVFGRMGYLGLRWNLQ